MPTFVWVGTLPNGETRKAKMEAANREEVERKLRAQQISIKSIRRDLGSIEIRLPGSSGVQLRDLMQFTRQFATLIDAGIPLVQALDSLAAQAENPTFRRVLTEVRADVEQGKTLADAMSRHPKVFDSLFVNLVAAGEMGGVLDTVMNRLAVYLEKANKVRRQVKGALTYPVVVLVIGVAIAVGLIAFVIPRFESLFADFNAALPAPTQFVIDLSHSFTDVWYLFAAGVVALVAAWKAIRANPRGRYVTDRLFLQIPVIGEVIRKGATARFTRTMATMLSSGVPILDALEIVAKSAGNKVIEEALMHARQRVSEGKTLAEPLAEAGVFPPMMLQMVAAGEASGTLDTLLTKAADFFDEEVDVAVSTMTSLIEPFVMMFLAVILGGLVITMYLPIFSLAGAISGNE